MTEWESRHRKYWDGIAAVYDSLYAAKWYQYEDLLTAHFLKRIIRPSDRVLEIGCGTGYGFGLVEPYLLNPAQYYGIDISGEMVKRAKEKFGEGPHFDSISLEEFDIANVGMVDVVLTTSGVFSYLGDIKSAVEICHALLGDEGRLIISVFSFHSARRLFGLRGREESSYPTRGIDQERGPPCKFYSSREISVLLNEHEFAHVDRLGFGAFSGVAQFSGLWTLDRMVCSFFPDVGHTLYVSGQKIAALG